MTITVDESPVFTNAANTTFTVGQFDAYTVTAADYPAPTFSINGNPSWLHIDQATGILSGTALNLGSGPYTVSFTITASNGIGSPTTENFTLTVDQAPAFTSADHTTFIEGQAGTFTVAATGNPAPTFSLSGNPPWLLIDSTTGVLARSSVPDLGAGAIPSRSPSPRATASPLMPPRRSP